ncbi:MAG: selenium-dependent xanthine dehydrogenase [Gemmatimonadales bacterium]|nr:selenium-dependent xanthine dehydrogenase [Gemmatimonadales bacterium]
MIRFSLNGKEIEYTGDPEATLLQWLRCETEVKSVKDGCSGQGTCGACIVELNGKPSLACCKTMGKLENTSIVTLEGIPEKTRRVLGEAFVASGAVQCGFCSPGMLTRTKLLLEKNPTPTREEVTKKIKSHLCRCTGYVKIVDAIMLASEVFNNGKEIVLDDSAFGMSPPKFQAFERAVGKPLFVGGMKFENLLHGALHFSDHPRARVLKINTAKAEAMDGVVRVFTAKDVPGQRSIGLIVNDWDVYIAEGETTRCIGDVLAMVVAETKTISRQAAALIEVEYEVLEPVVDTKQALEDDIKVHEGGNLLKESTICYGEDVEAVFKNSKFVVSDTFQTQVIEHAFMELENSVAQYEDGRLTVYSQGQGIYEDRHQIAALLGLETKDINVKLVAAGGAFGGKEDLTVQGHAALAAFHLRQAVKVKLDRTESMRMHPKRHPMRMEYKLGCDGDGKFTALHARIVGDTGAYASVGGPVMERAATHAGGAYYIPNIDVKSKAVYTNNIVCGAMRGFGVNQVTFAIEGLIDELCDTAGFDRWEIRYKNALDKGLKTTSGHKLRKEVGLKKTLELVKKDYDSGMVTGLACAIKNCGLGNGIPELSGARLEILEGGKIRLYHGWSEMGQGIDTIAQQMLSEYLGLDIVSKIEVIVNTDSETKAGNTTASRGTFLVGKAVLAAAEDLKKDLEKHSLSELAGRSYDGSYLCDWTTPSDFDGEIISHFAYSFATHLVTLSDAGKITKVTAAHDSGIVVNRKLYEGQVEGGVVMGLGYALSENLVLEKGQIVDPRFKSLGLLRSTDVPEIEVIPVEIFDTDAPLGAKGLGEICCIPTAAAAAGAYRKFDGKKRCVLPLDPVEK